MSYFPAEKQFDTTNPKWAEIAENGRNVQ